MASKCEDVSFIGVEDLAESSDHAFRKDDILSLEEVVLNALGFDLGKATAADFLEIFVQQRRWRWREREGEGEEERANRVEWLRRGIVADASTRHSDERQVERRSIVSLGACDVDETTYRLAEYILLVSLLDLSYSMVMPSTMAAAALVLAEWALRCESLAALARCPQEWFKDKRFTLACDQEKLDAAEKRARLVRGARSSVALTSWQQQLELRACLTMGLSPAPYSHGLVGTPVDEMTSRPHFPVRS